MKKTLSYILLSLVATAGMASHIVGGDISFQQIKGQRYEVKIQIFIDCLRGNENAYYEDPLFLGLYSKTTNKLVRSIKLNLTNERNDTLKVSRKSCAEVVDYCMLNAVYSDTLFFDSLLYNDTNGYYLSWERCCRNKAIINIKNPEETGIAFYAEIAPFSKANSSPVFGNTPVNILCQGSFFTQNFKISDPDGDSLVMSLVSPKKGSTNPSNPNAKGSNDFPILRSAPYDEVEWKDNFGLETTMLGDPELSIDPATGVVSVTPMALGDFVFAIRVEEYRKGNKIGEVTRELQYNVTKCSGNTAPVLGQAFTGLDQDTIELYAGEVFKRNAEFTDVENDSVFIRVRGEIFDAEDVGDPEANLFIFQMDNSAEAKVVWSPSCEQIRDELYRVTIEGYDNGCPFSAVSRVEFYIKVSKPPTYPKPDPFCVSDAGPDSVLFTWDMNHYGRYYKGMILEKKELDSPWVALDTINGELNISSVVFAKNHRTQNQCFRIRPINICKEKGTPTDSFCSTEHLGVVPKQSNVLNISVNTREQIELTWSQNTDFDFSHYQIYREKNDLAFVPFVKIFDQTDTLFIDSLVRADSNYFSYYVVVIDDCEDVSDSSQVATSMRLLGKVSPYEYELLWNGLVPWTIDTLEVKGVSFEKEHWRYSESNNFGNHTHEITSDQHGIWTYRLRAVHSQGLESYSNSVELIQDPVVWIPNAFTPNKDGLNDAWDAIFDFTQEGHIQIYSRWGQLVYESDDLSEVWDATDEMEINYLYIVEYRGLDHKIYSRTGSIVLVR